MGDQPDPDAFGAGELFGTNVQRNSQENGYYIIIGVEGNSTPLMPVYHEFFIWIDGNPEEGLDGPAQVPVPPKGGRSGNNDDIRHYMSIEQQKELGIYNYATDIENGVQSDNNAGLSIPTVTQSETYPLDPPDLLGDNSAYDGVTLSGLFYEGQKLIPVWGSCVCAQECWNDGDYLGYFGWGVVGLAEGLSLGVFSFFTVEAKVGTKVAAGAFSAVRSSMKLLTLGRFPNLTKKFVKHSGEWSQWGSISKEAYYTRAVNLADSPVGGYILGFTSKRGWSFRFNTRTGEFLTTHPNGHIETFFRPKQGINYYLKQIQKYGN